MSARTTAHGARTALVVLLLLALLLTASVVVRAQVSNDFDLSWHVIAGGGDSSASADYRVQGTLGQPLAGPPASTGGALAVTGGFWGGARGASLFLPAVLVE